MRPTLRDCRSILRMTTGAAIVAVMLADPAMSQSRGYLLARINATDNNVTTSHNATREVIRNEHAATRTQIVNAIEISTQQLIATLTAQAKQNSNYIDKSIEATKRIANAQELNETDRMRQQFRAEAESGKFDPNPFTCAVDDMFRAGNAGPEAVTGSDVATNARAYLAGDDEAVRQGGVALARAVIEERARFEGFQGSTHATTDWGILLNAPTVDFEDEETADLAQRIIINSIDPTPPRPLTDADMETPAGVAEAAEREKTFARQSAAAETMAVTTNMVTPVLEDTSGIFRSLAADSAYNRPVPEKLSEMQQLDIRTVSHYAPLAGGERSARLKRMNEKGWLEEIHRIMAINARTNYLRLELERRNAITDALILASMNES